eukprot:6209093-Amphidinium_carterae.1
MNTKAKATLLVGAGCYCGPKLSFKAIGRGVQQEHPGTNARLLSDFAQMSIIILRRVHSELRVALIPS